MLIIITFIEMRELGKIRLASIDESFHRYF